MLTETRTITINDEGLEPWLVDVVRNTALLFPQIRAVKLFGSYATGKIHPQSDVDLAFETDEIDRTTWRHITDIVNITDKLTKVDCIHLNKAPPGLRNEIERDGKAIYVR